MSVEYNQKHYPHYLLQSDYFNLNTVCSQFRGMFDNYGVFLVGSVLRKKDFRDVDLRCIIPDEKFKSIFGKECDDKPPLVWRVVCCALSEYIRNRTGLPVDFQIQGITYANKEFPVGEGNTRNAIGMPL